MDPGVKRIGDVIIERVGSEKKSKDEDPPTTMNTDTDSGSDSQSSDDELILDPPPNSDSPNETSPGAQSCNPSTSHSGKRKHEFPDTDLTHSKKTKTKYNDEESGSAPDVASGSGHGNAAAQDGELDNSEPNLQNSVSLDVDEELDKSDLLGETSELKCDILSRTRLHSDNEDSEYDSEEESDGEEASSASKLDAGASAMDAEKTDFIEKLASELGESSSQKSDDAKLDGSDYDYDITEKLKEMGEISVETVKKGDKPRKSETMDSTENEISVTPAKRDSGSDSEDINSSERKIGNMRRNIREVMDETQLDEATLAAQRQEMERLRRVQEQQKIIREVQRQIALNRQNNKTQHRVISLLQGNSSIIKQMPGTSGSTTNRIGGTVLVKLPNGETKPMTRITKGQTPFELVRLQKGAIQGKVQRNLIPMKKAAGGNLTPSVSIAPVTKKIEPKTGDTDSETETSDTEKKVKKVAGKPKDVVTISSSSDDDCIVLSEDEPEEPEPDEDPCNSGMHTNDAYNVPDEQGRVLINVGHPENETDIYLAPQIARVIKPHQIGGVRFLYDNVIESTDRFSTSTGFGCILAHSMGLGKTLQVVCFSDIFLRHTPAKTILCIMPINTLQNWMAEYNMWLPKDVTNSPLLSHGEVRPRNFNIYVLNDSHKTLAARAKVIQEWHRDGGVLLIGYELYRLLSLRRNPKSKSKRKKITATIVEQPETPEADDKNKSLFEEIHEALVKPGPDLVICDEGHRIKNSHASISQALKLIRSKRRIVLTGYPLQNNLLEYWCMVDFVRPNYLGTKTEFSNMFERPIQNGQCIDSTPQDIRLMRYRAHVLHSLLEGFVQRRSHAVLQTSLPQKEEYVLLVRMTEFQRKLYDTFMNEVVRTKTVPNPLKAFAVCCKIWNHPDVLYYFLKKHTQGEAVDIDLEEVAGTAATAAAGGTTANGTTGTTAATPKKGSSRSKGGAKKEKKTAASKSSNATTASPNNAKPAASVTPNTNAPTPIATPIAQPNLPNQLNIPNPGHPNQPIPNPGLQSPPNYGQPNPNYPGPPYPNQHMPYPHQNYPQYPQNGDYYNQNQGYPNSYNPGYYPNQEYGGFYENKPEGYPQTYQHDNQNYWQHNNPQPGNQYGGYNQNGAQNDYYGNMQAQPHPQPGYGAGNQDYYRQNQYNQGYPQNNVYQPNNTGYPQHQQWPQPQQVQPQPGQPQAQAVQPAVAQPPQQGDYKPEIKQEFKAEGNAEAKEECDSKVTPIHKADEAAEPDKDEAAGNKIEAKEEDKKTESTEQTGVKDEGDEKVDKEGETKPGEVAATTVTKMNVKEDPGIPYDWAQELMKGYIPGCIDNSAKMEIFFCILQESMALGDRILLFSQSLFTLNLIEEFLQRSELPGTTDKWARNKNYYRLDGSTSALEREKLINEYNSNPNIHLFLVSTRAGSLGINLVGANRVIVFDASWNPCHDTQAVCRVYRYGQKKPCFVYRIVMDNCLEKKIYDRQINKQGMADRVVDECNPDAHLSMKDVTNLCWDDEKDTEVKDFSTTKDKYIDVVMQKVLDAYSSRLSKEPFQHESLLIDRKEKKLSQAEKRLAKRSYELEKQANINSRPSYTYYNNGTGQGLQIRAIRTQDGMLQNKPVASVRPMQSEQMVRDIARPGGAAQGRSRWIPAEVWQRQGMTAQEMTLPLDVVIPTNSPDRGSIVLKAGQKVLVLKSPKGIYMQLECGKIVAIKTAFKVRGGKAPEKGEDGANKETPPPTTILKKVPQAANTSKTTPGTVPLPLKNNSAITVIPKGGQQRVVKPFTQSVTKLNMRSIRQPVPNLVGRQVPVRMGGGPRFTGKIQSVQRKVQLAKAKPYNLDKSSDPLKAMDSSSIKNEPRDREDHETHIVPSSDEDMPLDQHVDPSEKKDDDSADAIECADAEMFSESEKSMETDLERLSNAEFADSSQIDRRQSTDSYQSSEKQSSSDGFTNLDRFPHPERFPSTESFSGASDQYQNLDKYPITPEKFPNTDKYAAVEKYQNLDKFPISADKFPSTEKYPNTERNSNIDKYPMQGKFGGSERFGAPENFAERFPQTDKYSGYPDRYPNPAATEKFGNQDRFATTPEKFPNPVSMVEKFHNAVSLTEKFPSSGSLAEKFPNSGSLAEKFPNPAATVAERYPNTNVENFAFSAEKFANPERFGHPEKFGHIEKYPNPERFGPPDKYPNAERFGQNVLQSEKFPQQAEKFQNPERYPQAPSEKFPHHQPSEKFPNPERYPQQQAEKFPNSERYPQQQAEKFPNPERYPQQQAEKFPNPERYPQQQAEKFPNPERYPQQQAEKFPNPERYPQQQAEKFPNPERYPQQQVEKFPNPERYPQQQAEKFTNPERYPQQQAEKFPSTERYPQQHPEKFSNTERYPQTQSEKFPQHPPQTDKFPITERYPQTQPEKFANTERYPQTQPEKFANTERYPQHQAEKFPASDRYPPQEKYSGMDKFPGPADKYPNMDKFPAQTPEKYPGMDKFSAQTSERYPTADQYQSPEKYSAGSKYPAQPTYANMDNYPGVGSYQKIEKFPTLEKSKSSKDGAGEKIKHSSVKDGRSDKSKQASNSFLSNQAHNTHSVPNMPQAVANVRNVSNPVHAVPTVPHSVSNSSYSISNIANSGQSGANLSHTGSNLSHSVPNLSHSVPNLSHAAPNSGHPGKNLSHTVPNLSHSGPNSGHSGGNLTHTGPNSVHAGSNLTHTGPNSGHTGSNLTHTGPNSGHTGSNLTHTGPNSGHARSNLDHAGPNMGHPGSNTSHAASNVSHASHHGQNPGHLGHATNPSHNVSNPHHSLASSIYSGSNPIHTVPNPNYSVSNPMHTGPNSTYAVSNPSYSNSSHPGPNQPHPGSNLSQPGSIVSHTVSNQSRSVTNQPHSVASQPHAVSNQPHSGSNQPHSVSNQQHSVASQQHSAASQQHSLSNQSHTVSNMPHAVSNLTQPPSNLPQPGPTIPPQPAVVHEQSNTSRSLKNYRHNFASQKAHNQGNFGATKVTPKSAATSSALHQLEQTTVSIGENKQPFQESLDSITNSYGGVPPTAGGGPPAGDPKSSEESHIIDLDAEKNEVEIVEKPTKTSSKSSHSTPAPTEPTKPAAQPPQPLAQTAKADAPTQPQEFSGYNNYYGYSPHVQPYAQPQPGLPPQTFYAPPEATQHYPEVKSSKVEKPAAPQPSTTPAAPQTSSRSEPAPATDPTPAPTHHSTTSSAAAAAAAAAGYAASPSSFAPYGQPAIPPPPHGAYDMMSYPQQNQYSANYPGLPYPNQPSYQPPYQPPYQPDQASGYPPGPTPNMYSAFHRPDVHQYAAAADPYAHAQPHYTMRNAYAHHQYPYASPAAAAAQGMYPAAPAAAPGYDYQYNANAFPPPPPPPAAFVNPYSGLPNNSPVP